MSRANIVLGRFSQNELNRIIGESSQIDDIGRRIDFLSRQFFAIDYVESTLIGDKDTPEVFVINFGGVDCFTFIEYVEAMRLSETFSQFELNLRKVRYKSGEVSFLNRNHFLTDWREFNSDLVEDVTGRIGANKTIRIQKVINEKGDGTYFLPGIPPVNREISYIPSDVIDNSVLGELKTGDYTGIYSHREGLDVSHVGIIVKNADRIYLRHASSQEKYRKVIDQDFKEYMADKPGIMVLRPHFSNPKLHRATATKAITRAGQRERL